MKDDKESRIAMYERLMRIAQNDGPWPKIRGRSFLVDARAGSWVWTREDSNVLVYATPYWEGENGIALHATTEEGQLVCDKLWPFDGTTMEQYFAKMDRFACLSDQVWGPEPKEEHATRIAKQIMDDGMFGNFFRAELGAPACGDWEQWIRIAIECTKILNEGIATMRSNNT